MSESLKPTSRIYSFVEKTASDTVSKTISTLLAGAIIAILAGLVAIVAGLPYWSYIPIAAAVFFLVSVGLRLFRRKPILPANHETIQRELEQERANHKQLKGDYDRLDESYKTGAQLYEDLYKEKEKLERTLNKHSWLFDKAKLQAEEISNYVVIEDATYMAHDFRNSIPVVMFTLSILNESVYDIEITSLGGEITFKATSLLDQKQVRQTHVKLDAGSRKAIIIDQRLSRSEIEYIRQGIRQRETGEDLRLPEFEFQRLQINVKGTEDFPQVKPAVLDIHRRVTVNMERKDFR